MEKIRIGIICPSEIAYRRFMPALSKCEEFEYVGVAYPTLDEWDGASLANIELEIEKAEKFKEAYGGKIFNGYQTLINDSSVDAVYLPLPPALHYRWAKKSLQNNKHVFLEKPSTTNFNDTQFLINIAKEKKLALHENYMFQYHNQIDSIRELIKEKKVGELRLIRTNFGFPKRGENDFRYNKKLGGGALLDCGGYPVRLMSVLLGDEMKVDYAKLFYNDSGVDLYGSVQLSTNDIVSQISFGMDNSYKCDIEIWGSNGTIYTNRIFTAPEGYETEIHITNNNKKEIINVEGDDTFKKSIDLFYQCIICNDVRENEYNELSKQINLIEEIGRENNEKIRN